MSEVIQIINHGIATGQIYHMENGVKLRSTGFQRFTFPISESLYIDQPRLVLVLNELREYIKINRL